MVLKTFSFLFLFFLFSFTSINLISSAPPFIPPTQSFTEGFELKYPSDFVLTQNQPYEFEIHVYNISNGYPITSGIICYFHLYNSTGKHQLVMTDSTPSHIFDYSFDVKAGNFSEAGDYYYLTQCNSSSLGGFVEVPFVVTPSGKIDLSILNNPMIIILGLLGLVLVLFGTWKGIPWFGFIGSILFLLLGIYTMIYGFNNITDLYTQGVAITFIGMGIIFMFSSAYEWLYDNE